jgi:PIN domain nuclease of toxin-antitoxin system
MRLLLDTHIFLWAVTDPKQLLASAVAKIIDPSNDVAVSAATAWEICIKSGTGKLSGPAVGALTDARQFRKVLAQSGIIAIDVELDHVFTTRRLPLHHRDPFDRMLIAQAMATGRTLMTRDRMITRYSGVKLAPA